MKINKIEYKELYPALHRLICLALHLSCLSVLGLVHLSQLLFQLAVHLPLSPLELLLAIPASPVLVYPVAPLPPVVGGGTAGLSLHLRPLASRHVTKDQLGRKFMRLER